MGLRLSKKGSSIPVRGRKGQRSEAMEERPSCQGCTGPQGTGRTREQAEAAAEAGSREQEESGRGQESPGEVAARKQAIATARWKRDLDAASDKGIPHGETESQTAVETLRPKPSL